MKSQVGLGRLYPDGRFDNTQQPPAEQVADAKQDEAGSGPVASELVSVVVHVEKAALNELLQKSSQS